MHCEHSVFFSATGQTPDPVSGEGIAGCVLVCGSLRQVFILAEPLCFLFLLPPSLTSFLCALYSQLSLIWAFSFLLDGVEDLDSAQGNTDYTSDELARTQTLLF